MDRQPLWTTDEVILVLSLYFEHGTALPATHPAVIEVSRVMSALPVNVSGDHAGTVRNPGAVAMKLANFAHAANPREGLRNVGPRDQKIFSDYANRREDCRRLAEKVREISES